MSSLRKSWQKKKKWNYLCKEKRSTWGLRVSNTTTIVRRTQSPGLLLQTPRSMLLKFPESPKTQKDSPRIQMIRNSERQKVGGIRLREAILSPEFFPRKKLMPKAGSTPHTLNNGNGEKETSLEEAKASAVETATAGARVGHSSAAFRPQAE